jgi:hypothetical protein
VVTPLGEPGKEAVDALQAPAPAGALGDLQVFLHRERREDVASLRHVAETEARALVDRELRHFPAAQQDRACVEGGVAHQRGEQGGLADAVAAEDGERAALGD